MYQWNTTSCHPDRPKLTFGSVLPWPRLRPKQGSLISSSYIQTLSLPQMRRRELYLTNVRKELWPEEQIPSIPVESVAGKNQFGAFFMHKTFTTCLFCTLQSWPRSCSPAHAAPAVWLDCTYQRRSGSRVGETFRRVPSSWPCSIWSALRLPMTSRQENTLLRSHPRNSSLFPWYVLFKHNNLWLQKKIFYLEMLILFRHIAHLYLLCLCLRNNSSIHGWAVRFLFCVSLESASKQCL